MKRFRSILLTIVVILTSIRLYNIISSLSNSRSSQQNVPTVAQHSTFPLSPSELKFKVKNSTRKLVMKKFLKKDTFHESAFLKKTNDALHGNLPLDGSLNKFLNTSWSDEVSTDQLKGVKWSNDSSNEESNVLSRKKRYILFPDGSTFTAAVCSTQTVIGSDTGTAEYTESFVWALVYDLPSTLQEFGLMKRRKRRDVHRTMAQLLDRANIKGEDCILKSMCEIHDVVKPKLGIAEEILRILFSIPKDEQGSSEEDYTNEDDNLNTRTIEQTTEEEGVQDCNEKYPECPVSLLQMLLGLQVESIELKR